MHLVTLFFLLFQGWFSFLNGSDSTPTYRNPVIAENMPDPTFIRAEDGFYYVYATERAKKLPIYRSLNLTDWTFVGHAFKEGERPSFEPKGNVWAPDINYFNGHYVMYYAMSVWGGEQTCGIGVATAARPEGPFIDQGKLFRSNEIGVRNSIDPCYMEDEGKKYLIWGSFRGIYGIELSDDGLHLSSDTTKFKVAGTAYEGVYVYKSRGYYYLFASIGTCCKGLESTYTTVVGRSKHLKGPYLNKQGQAMLNNKHQVIIHKNERFVGCGHNAEIVTDRKGKTWMLLHAFDTTNPKGRQLILQEILWDKEDWPYVRDDSPAIKAKAPSFE